MKNIWKYIVLFAVLFVGFNLLEYRHLVTIDLSKSMFIRRGAIKSIFYFTSYSLAVATILAIVLSTQKFIRITGIVLVAIFLAIDLSSLEIIGENVGFADVNAAISLPSFFPDFVNFHKFTVMKSTLVSLLFLVGFAVLASIMRVRLKKRFLTLSFFAASSIYVVLWQTSAFIDIYPSPIRIPMLVLYRSFNSLYLGPREEVTLAPIETETARHIVFIVDESIRGDMLSLNGYEKDTTPFLRSISKNFLNFGIASSATNISSGTNIILQTGLRLEQCPDEQQLSLKQANIFQFAKKAGYKTYFLNAQTKPEIYENFMKKADFEHIDESYFPANFEGVPSYARDEYLATKMKEILSDKTPSFVYVNKWGAHVSWETAYPPEQMIFQPTMGEKKSIAEATEEEALNSYLNATRWSVDTFFEELRSLLNQDRMVFLYTSDHGQSVKEGGYTSTHADRKKPPSSQANVPFIIFGPYAKRYFTNGIEPLKNSLNHFQIFPSLLVMMGYDEEQVRKLYGSPLWGKLSKEQNFVSGDIYGRGSFYINRFSKE